MLKYITKEDIDYMKRVLENYKYHKDKYKSFLALSIELQEKVDSECEISGISFDNTGGSTTSTPMTPYINELIITQASAEVMASNEKKAYLDIEKRDKLLERIKCISHDQQCTIYAIYFKGESYDEFAEREGIKKPAISERISSAVKSMLEVDL